MTTKKQLTLAYMIWFSVVLFYLYQYILRVAPSVMANDLMEGFHISASGLGSLSSFYLYCYALMQIPVGMLVDHYGTRRMVLFSIFLCVSGVILFSHSEQLIFGYLARMMMGTGSACAFLSVSKTVNEWFPDSHKGFMMSLTPTLGTFGALLGQRPLVMLIENQGWRTSLLILALIGSLILLLNFLTLPSTTRNKNELVPGEESASFTSLIAVFKSRQAWIYALVAFGIYLSISVVADLWGISFVEEKFNIRKDAAADAISFMYYGTAIGCPLFAWISRVIGSVRQAIIGGALGIIMVLASIVFIPDIPLWLANIGFFLIGICTGAEILCFIAACNLMGPEVAATMTGFLNCIVSLAGAMIQQHVGIVLDYFWEGEMAASGIPIYSVYTYKIAFAVILFFTLISCILAWFIKSEKDASVDHAPKCT